MAVKVKTHNPAGEAHDQDSLASQFARYLFEVEEAERRRLARELHDETAQGLTLVRFYLGMLQQVLPQEKDRKTVDEAFAVLDRTIEGLRRIVARLSPRALEKLGLIGSIRKEARNLASARGLQVKVTTSESFGRLSTQSELALYRLVQEALHNVGKHAKAKHVEIDLSRTDDQVSLRIEDDGTGFTKRGSLTGRFGIFGMRERVRSLSGTFRIRSRRGRGTRIEVFLTDPPPALIKPAELPQLHLVPAESRRGTRQSKHFARYRHA
jgi:signal transduction histidine kinase